MNNIALIKRNWLTIRVIVASVFMATVTFCCCYLWFNYEVKIWSIDDYNKGYTKVKFSNPRSNSECIFALFINKRR